MKFLRLTLAPGGRLAASALLFLFLAHAPPLCAQTYFNLNFGSGTNTGVVATGSGANDFWNIIPAATTVASNYTYYAGSPTVAVITWGTTSNLLWSDSSTSTISVTITNLTTLATNGSPNVMFNSYLSSMKTLVSDYVYSPPPPHPVYIYANPKVVITNLPASTYEIYIYGSGNSYGDNEGYSITIGTNAASSVQWTTRPYTLSTNWQQNTQYVKFTNQVVAANETVTINFSGNGQQRHLINGIQIVDPNGTSGTPTLTNVVFDPGSGATVPVDVTLSVPGQSGTTIYYTTDGSTPTTNSSVYSSALSLTTATTLKAFATKSGYNDSSVSTASYTLPQLPYVTFSPASGAFLPVTVTMSVSGHGDATIYYTTNNTTPTTNSAVYTGPVSLSSNVWYYSPNIVPYMTGYTTPSGRTVTYSTELSGSTAYAWKAFDRASPSQDNNHWSANSAGPEWVAFDDTSPHIVSKYAITCRANSGDGPKAWNLEGWNGSAYVLLDARTNVTGWAGSERREFICATNGSYNKYRLYVYEGNASSLNTGAKIVIGELELYQALTTVMAFATKANYSDSLTTYAEYHTPAGALPHVCPPPSVTPGGGSYTDITTVTLTTTLPGASNRYTTNGTDWVTGSSVILDRNTTLLAQTTKSGYTDSDVVTNVYSITLTAPTPTASPTGGTYNNDQTVTLSSTLSGSAIQYSLDNGANWTAYTTGLAISQNSTVLAKCTKANYQDSAIATNTYFFAVAATTISPNGGTFTNAQTVTLTNVTAGAAIQYSTNNGATWINYTNSFTLDGMGTGTGFILAQATRANYASSSNSSALFIFTTLPPVFSVDSGEFTNAFYVTLTTGTTNATIEYNYFNTDWRTYTTNLLIKASVSVYARVSKPGYLSTGDVTYSAADEFSPVQGLNNWTYNYSDTSQGLPARALPFYDFNFGAWRIATNLMAMIAASIQTTTTTNDTVRTFVAPHAGNISIASQVLYYGPDTATNMIRVRVLKNTSTLINWTYCSGGAAGLAMNGTTNVAVGDLIQFQVNGNGNAVGAVKWSPTLTYSNFKTYTVSDYDGNALLYGLEMLYGPRPDYSDTDADHYIAYLQGRDPSLPSVADTNGQVQFQRFTPLE